MTDFLAHPVGLEVSRSVSEAVNEDQTGRKHMSVSIDSYLMVGRSGNQAN